MAENRLWFVWFIRLLRYGTRAAVTAWALWVVAWTFVVAYTATSNTMGRMLEYSIVGLATLAGIFFFVGAVVAAWRNERFGGRMLLIEGACIVVYFAWLMIWDRIPLVFGMVILVTAGLPPLAAGLVFRWLHRRDSAPATPKENVG